MLPPMPALTGAGTLVPFERDASGGHDALPLDVVFPVLHGTFGEDGTIQGLFELAGMAYVGSGVLGSATGMDKEVMKRLFAAAGLPITKHVTLLRREWQQSPRKAVARLEAALKYPLFVKPANLGSSVGISKGARPQGAGAGHRTGGAASTAKSWWSRRSEAGATAPQWARHASWKSLFWATMNLMLRWWGRLFPAKNFTTTKPNI